MVIRCLLALILLTGLAAAGAQQHWPEPSIAPLPFVEQGPGIGESGAAHIAARSTGGRVLSVRSQGKSGRVVYRVKLLMPDGRVRSVRVDGATGAVQ
jgi:hypothetical protein